LFELLPWHGPDTWDLRSCVPNSPVMGKWSFFTPQLALMPMAPIFHVQTFSSFPVTVLMVIHLCFLVWLDLHLNPSARVIPRLPLEHIRWRRTFTPSNGVSPFEDFNRGVDSSSPLRIASSCNLILDVILALISGCLSKKVSATDKLDFEI